MRMMLGLLSFGLAWIHASDARTDGIDVTSTPVTVTELTARDGTTYYSIGFNIPNGLSSVSHAWLEFRADISARELNGFTDPAPMLEVYALKQALSGDPDPSEFEPTAIPMSRPVATGANRLVRVDITEIVQMILAEPSKNHGIVLGPLTADKRGIVDLKQDGFGPGIAARVHIAE